MYFSDPITPSALAATGISAAHGLIAPAVLIFAGLALYTIARRLKMNLIEDTANGMTDMKSIFGNFHTYKD